MLDHSQIRALLRQRPPMLLLDTVRECSPPSSLIATKAITGSESCYRHLAEGAGIAGFAYPLALLLESFGQAVSLLWTLGGLCPPDRIPLMGSIRDLTAGEPAVPGDVLEHHVSLRHQSGTIAEFAGETRTAMGIVLTVGTVLVVARPANLLTDPGSATTSEG